LKRQSRVDAAFGRSLLRGKIWIDLWGIIHGENRNVFVNGIEIMPYITDVFVGLVLASAPLFVGVYGLDKQPHFFKGRLDELRISDIVRYKSPVTLPNGPFTADEHTIALWHFDEPVGSQVFADSSGNNYTLVCFAFLLGCGGEEDKEDVKEDVISPRIGLWHAEGNAKHTRDAQVTAEIVFDFSVPEGTKVIRIDKTSFRIVSSYFKISHENVGKPENTTEDIMDTFEGTWVARWKRYS